MDPIGAVIRIGMSGSFTHIRNIPTSIIGTDTGDRGTIRGV
jgi:hypothetical protein